MTWEGKGCFKEESKSILTPPPGSGTKPVGRKGARAARYLTCIVDKQEVPLYQREKRKSRKSKAKALEEFIDSVVPVVPEAVLSKLMW